MSEPNRAEMVAMLNRACVDMDRYGWDSIKVNRVEIFALRALLDRPDPAPVADADELPWPELKCGPSIRVKVGEAEVRKVYPLSDDNPPPVAAPHDLAGLAAMCRETHTKAGVTIYLDSAQRRQLAAALEWAAGRVKELEKGMTEINIGSDCDYAVRVSHALLAPGEAGEK